MKIINSICRRGFTLVEVMIAVALFSLVVAGSAGVYIMCQKFWHATTLNIQTTEMTRKALSWIINGNGTNAGLREASRVDLYSYPSTVANSAYLHSHLSPWNYFYWDIATNNPPQAYEARIDFNCSYPTFNDGGSWQLKYTTPSSGDQYIEYNFPFRTLSLGTNHVNRVLLATYVSSAVVTTNAQGVGIALTVMRRDGNLVSTSSASAYVQFRNNL